MGHADLTLMSDVGRLEITDGRTVHCFIYVITVYKKTHTHNIIYAC